MSAMQRHKGQSGEREIAGIVRDLTGWDMRRRVRQHGGDSHLEGAPGWAVEVKRYRTAGRAEIAAWWRQSGTGGRQKVPVLFYRQDRAEGLDVWPLAARRVEPTVRFRLDYEWTIEETPSAWAAVARKTGNRVPLVPTDTPYALTRVADRVPDLQVDRSGQEPNPTNTLRQRDLFEFP